MLFIVNDIQRLIPIWYIRENIVGEKIERNSNPKICDWNVTYPVLSSKACAYNKTAINPTKWF